MIAIIDFGGGNVGSLYAGFRRRTANVVVTGDPEIIRSADAAVLPGDGAYGATIAALQERGLLSEVSRFIERGRPFLGICVGMQILYAGSDEFGETRGLGYFPGQISLFRDVPRIPHIGWSSIAFERSHPITAGLGDTEYTYFMHSYRAEITGSTVATAANGASAFSAICARDNVIGMQFHPEKSQDTGAKLLANFVRMSMGEEPA